MQNLVTALSWVFHIVMLKTILILFYILPSGFFSFSLSVNLLLYNLSVPLQNPNVFLHPHCCTGINALVLFQSLSCYLLLPLEKWRVCKCYLDMGWGDELDYWDYNKTCKDLFSKTSELEKCLGKYCTHIKFSLDLRSLSFVSNTFFFFFFF